ncbi:hypothetical protein [Frisingicoccus sp.]|uniref:hypothetical protein n=1 Tax=Frisingicoccus sp. TaxID=1918627 RepID=UPI0025BB10DF|nr:hypothetical protein [Frisingicoccus sp.]
MLRYEWKKVFGSRPVIISVFVLLLVNAIICYFQTKPNPKELPRDTLLSFWETYVSNETEMQKEYQQMQNFVSEQQRIWSEQMALGNREYEMQTWKNKYAPEGYQDAQLFNHIISIKEYVQNYQSKIDHAIRTAYAQIINSSPNGLDTGSYIYRYQAEVIRLYQNIQENVSLTPEYVSGWNKYFSYDFMPVFLLLSTMIVSGFVFTNEHQLGVTSLIFTTKHGRLHTAVSKLIVIYGSAIILCLLFCAETLFIINITTGLSNTSSPIQMVSTFLYCPYVFSIKEYIIIDFVFKLIATLIFTVISAAISTGFHNYLFTYISSLGVLGIDYIFFIMKYPSSENFIRAVNLMSISTSSTILDRYRAIRIGDTPLSYISVIIITFVLVVVLTAFIILKYSHCYTVKNASPIKIKRRTLSIPLQNSFVFKREFSMSLFISELYKLIISSKLFLVIAILFLVKLSIVYIDFHSTKSFADEIYNYYTNELSGPIDEEKRTYISNERKYILETLNNYASMSDAYANGEISLDDYRAYLSDYNYAFSHDEIFKQIESHVSYIDKMANEGKEAWFVYDTGWKKLLTRGFDWSLYALVLILCSNVFAAEYNTRTSSEGFHQILRTTKHGRKKTFYQKVRTVVTLSLIFSFIWTVIDYIAVLMAYKLPQINAPIWSIEIFSDIEYNINIWQFAVLSAFVKLHAYMVLAILTTSFSLISQKSSSTIIYITMLTLIPRILSTLGISALNRIDYVDVMEATPILLRSIEGAAFSIIVIISSLYGIFETKRMWSK